jgi:hypothetical protein
MSAARQFRKIATPGCWCINNDAIQQAFSADAEFRLQRNRTE